LEREKRQRQEFGDEEDEESTSLGGDAIEVIPEEDEDDQDSPNSTMKSTLREQRFPKNGLEEKRRKEVRRRTEVGLKIKRDRDEGVQLSSELILDECL
jgi:hypothetical protein